MLRLSFLRRSWFGAPERDATVDASRTRYAAALATFDWRAADDGRRLFLAEMQRRAGLSAKADERLRRKAFVRACREAVRLNDLAGNDEKQLLAFAATLGIDPNAVSARREREVWLDVVISGASQGRSPLIRAEAPALVTRPGEIVHLVTAVDLLRNGEDVDIDDSGQLTITSQRALFAGERRALEFAYPKLIELRTLPDGVRLAVSNRQTPSRFRSRDARLLAAVLYGAATSAVAELRVPS